MKFIFKETATSTEIALPVTPKGFDLNAGIRVETVNIHTVGDVIIGGYGTLASIKIPCIFPAQAYPFAANDMLAPYDYIEKFQTFCTNRTVLRFIVTDTPVNLPVLISDIQYGEKDFTGDVYAALSLREYRYVTVAQTQKEDRTGNESREVEAAPPPTMDTYEIVKGDTLWAICKKFYGDPKLCYELAKYNDIKNANLIYTGNTLNLPDKSLLKGA